MVVDDFDTSHGVVFQGDPLGYIWSFNLSVFRGTLVPCQNKHSLLLLQALKTSGH